MRLADDEPALGAWTRCGLNGDVAPGVVVVDQPIILLPVHVLRWCGALKERERKRENKNITHTQRVAICMQNAAGELNSPSQ